MTASSTPAIVAKSRHASRPSAVVITVWCAAPAESQQVAEVAKSGAGCQTARATGRLGSGSSGSTTSTTLAVRRNRSRMSDRARTTARSEEHTSELQSRGHLVCRLLLEKKKQIKRVKARR